VRLQAPTPDDAPGIASAMNALGASLHGGTEVSADGSAARMRVLRRYDHWERYAS
jgi:hypothetical protein